MGTAARLPTQQEALARWEAYADSPELASDESRYEIDAFGTLIVIPPPRIRHQATSMQLARQLEEQLGGLAVVECPVYAGGICVADVAWGQWKEVLATPVALVSPPLVVEVMSPSNTQAELQSKAQACLRHGVQEVGLVELDGRVRDVGPQGERPLSALGVALSAALDDGD